MAATAEKKTPNKVDVAAVQVGDRVKWGRSTGTVLSVSQWSRRYGMGSILWDGDAIPTMSVMGSWWRLRKA